VYWHLETIVRGTQVILGVLDPSIPSDQQLVVKQCQVTVVVLSVATSGLAVCIRKLESKIKIVRLNLQGSFAETESRYFAFEILGQPKPLL